MKENGFPVIRKKLCHGCKGGAEDKVCGSKSKSKLGLVPVAQSRDENDCGAALQMGP